MVNSPSSIGTAERRERPRASAEHAPALGTVNLNPFGDLVTLQHLSARLAKSMKGSFETLLRRELRAWAEPLSVQRFADYKAERGPALSAWQPLAIGAARAKGQLVLEAGLVFEMLDAFFGGDGEAPHPLPDEFTGSAETIVARLAQSLAGLLDTAWEPVARLSFRAEAPANLAAIPDFPGDDPVIVTRFGIAAGDAKPRYVDILYPVAALKPHSAGLMVKVHGDKEPIEPEWRSGLTRAVMAVTLPVRSVLAEPVLPLGRLLELREGDIIPIDFGPEVPVMVAARRLGTGLVGTANGRAAVRLTSLEPINAEDFQ
jgi:flagellar motor switch protein FliM